MGERVPIFPKNECYQYPAHSQKRQIHCRFQGAQPLGGDWGGAPKELCVHRAAEGIQGPISPLKHQ